MKKVGMEDSAKQVYGSKSKRSKVISELLTNGYSSFQKTIR